MTSDRLVPMVDVRQKRRSRRAWPPHHFAQSMSGNVGGAIKDEGPHPPYLSECGNEHVFGLVARQRSSWVERWTSAAGRDSLQSAAIGCVWTDAACSHQPFKCQCRSQIRTGAPAASSNGGIDKRRRAQSLPGLRPRKPAVRLGGRRWPVSGEAMHECIWPHHECTVSERAIHAAFILCAADFGYAFGCDGHRLYRAPRPNLRTGIHHRASISSRSISSSSQRASFSTSSV